MDYEQKSHIMLAMNMADRNKKSTIIKALNEIEQGNGDKAEEILISLLDGKYTYSELTHKFTYKEV